MFKLLTVERKEGHLQMRIGFRHRILDSVTELLIAVAVMSCAGGAFASSLKLVPPSRIAESKVYYGPLRRELVVPRELNRRFMIIDREASFIPEDFGRLERSSIEVRERGGIAVKDLSGQAPDYVIFGRRFQNTGGIPVVLSHGFLNNYWAMESIALELYRAGFDVFMFNHPGFGLSGERSFVKNSEVDSLGMAKLANASQQVLHFVHSLTGQKVSWIGFSMGGMILHQMLSGTIGNDAKGAPIRDSRVADEVRRMLRSAVAIGAPPYNLKGIATHVQATGMMLQVIMKLPNPADHAMVVPLGFGGKVTEFSREALLGKLIDFVPKYGLGSALVNAIIADIGDLDHFGERKNQFGHIFAREFSNPTVDNLKFWAKVNTLKVEPPIRPGEVPLMEIMGTRDRLANAPQLIDRAAQLHQINSQNVGLVLSNAGHYHLILPSIVRMMKDHLVQFLRDPDAYQHQARYRPLEIIETKKAPHKVTLELEKRYNKRLSETSSVPTILSFPAQCRSVFEGL